MNQTEIIEPNLIKDELTEDGGYWLTNDSDKGVLLIHGLTGTPNEMRITANGLHRAGFTVYAVKLAGHCGTEADLISTKWQDWYQSVQDGADLLATKVKHLFVAGLSMGALLALKLAIDRPSQIKGAAIYSITFYYDGWSIPFYAKKLFFLLRWFHRLNLFQDKFFIEQPPYGLKDERIRKTVSDSMLSGNSADAGLAGNPYRSLAEMQFMVKIIRKELKKIKVPCLVMHSTEDDIADIKTNGQFVIDVIQSSKRFVKLTESYHLITIDRQRKIVIDETIQFFNQIIQHKLVKSSEETY